MHDSGERKEFAGGGVRDGSPKADRFELLWNKVQPYEDQPMVEFARWMAKGAEKYEDRNWEEFSGSESEEHAIGSLLRHVYKFVAGWTDEDHGSAGKFNIDAIKVIRWKAQQATTSVSLSAGEDLTGTASLEPPKVRYFLDPDGWYFRTEVDGSLSYARSWDDEIGVRHSSDSWDLEDVEGFSTEIQINEVPEWAR